MKYKLSMLLYGLLGGLVFYLSLRFSSLGNYAVYKMILINKDSIFLLLFFITLIGIIFFHIAGIRSFIRIWKNSESTGIETLFGLNVIAAFISCIFLYIYSPLVKSTFINIFFQDSRVHDITKLGLDPNSTISGSFIQYSKLYLLYGIINIILFIKNVRGNEYKEILKSTYKKIELYYESFILIIFIVSSLAMTLLWMTTNGVKSVANIYNEPNAQYAFLYDTTSGFKDYEDAPKNYAIKNEFGNIVFQDSSEFLFDVIQHKGKKYFISCKEAIGLLEDKKSIYSSRLYKIYDEKGNIKFNIDPVEYGGIKEIYFLNDTIVVSQKIKKASSHVENYQTEYITIDYETGEETKLKDNNGDLITAKDMCWNLEKDNDTISVIDDMKQEIITFNIYSLTKKEIIGTYQLPNAYIQEAFKKESKIRFSKGYNLAYKDGYYGYIDNKGNTVVDFKFTLVESKNFQTTVLKDKNDNIGFVNEHGEILPNITTDGEEITGYISKDMYLTKSNDGTTYIYENSSKLLTGKSYDAMDYMNAIHNSPKLIIANDVETGKSVVYNTATKEDILLKIHDEEVVNRKWDVQYVSGIRNQLLIVVIDKTMYVIDEDANMVAKLPLNDIFDLREVYDFKFNNAVQRLNRY